jgi:antibiotic biosynthesis monooxygenase (ABM) superfamily enzyme
MNSIGQIKNDGATAVITHRVNEGQHDRYEQWLMKIIPLCKAYPGHLDWQVVRPIAGLSFTYTVIIRFDTQGNLQQWLNSSDRKRLIEEARPFLAAEDSFFTRSGLEFLFTPEGAEARVPKRWKQFLVTWAAIYPVSLFSQSVFAPIMHTMGIPENRYLKTFMISGIVVYLMVYVIMPRFTKLLKRWLYK